MTDEPATVLDRLIAAGIYEDRARAWVDAGGVRVDGEPVSSYDAPAPYPARVVLRAG